MTDDFTRTFSLYQRYDADRQERVPLWRTISRFVGISLDVDYLEDGAEGNKSRQLDEYVDDPTAAISVNQAGDYLLGIMWGTGQDVLAIEPSREVLDLVDAQAVQPFYDFATEETLEQMNHPEAGLNASLKRHVYDQPSFGTSGIGVFKNKQFDKGREQNVLNFKPFGVDNISIGEGKSGLVDYVFATYHWEVNRIVGEFCCGDNGVDEKLMAKMPNEVKEAWKNQDTGKKFVIVFGMMPRENYDPVKKGKIGTKYRGVWFFKDKNINSGYFLEEDFASKPIGIARAILVRGDKYGHASGTMLISTIRLVNFMVGQAIEVIEKLTRPSLGISSNALFGDAVLDTSPDGLTVFNSQEFGGQGAPIFPVADVGDPSALLNFLLPYLNEKIATAFKIDVLLDFSSAKDMTATESLQRFAIRGKSLAGLLTQEKVELLDVIVPRSVNLLLDSGRLGVDADEDPEAAQSFIDLDKSAKIIPEAVLRMIKEGKPWFKIKYKNELEQLTNTRNVESLMQFTQGAGMMSQLFPQLVGGIEWYDLLDDYRKSLNIPADKMVSKDDFEAKIEADQQMAQLELASQLGAQSAAADKQTAEAGKTRSETK